MSNEQIEKLVTQAVDELRKEKICLIEDIFKIYNHLHAMEVCGFKEILMSAGDEFDALYAMTIDELQLVWAKNRALLKIRANEIMKIDHE